MSYADQAALSNDAEFQARLAAAVTSEAKPKGDEIATQILKNPLFGAQMFGPFVVSEPGFSDAYAEGGQESITDAQLLSAIQANWDRVATTWGSPTPK